MTVTRSRRSRSDKPEKAFYPSSSHVLVQPTSAPYQTFPQSRSGPAVLVMAVPVRILMPIVFFGELADVQRMPRPVRTAEQRGRRELMTDRSAVNAQQTFLQTSDTIVPPFLLHFHLPLHLTPPIQQSLSRFGLLPATASHPFLTLYLSIYLSIRLFPLSYPSVARSFLPISLPSRANPVCFFESRKFPNRFDVSKFSRTRISSNPIFDRNGDSCRVVVTAAAFNDRGRRRGARARESDRGIPFANSRRTT